VTIDEGHPMKPSVSHVDLLTGFLSEPQRRVLRDHLDAGGSLLLKFDGQRDAEFWTVVLDGGALGEEGWFRRDGDAVAEMLAEGVATLGGGETSNGS
jgi:hypothetical protein